MLVVCFALKGWAQEEPKKDEEKQSIGHVGLIYPLSTNGVHAAEYSNGFSIHAIVGVSGSERSFCASGFSNIIRHHARGAVIAGFSNHVGGNVDGVQAAGFLNTNLGRVKGVQAAGFFNLAGGLEGFQAAGFGNVTHQAKDGIQAAGFFNVADTVHSQIGGFVNVAEVVEGVQIAGFINVARKVKGVQLSGFINIAEESDFPIGIVNIIKNGEKAIGVTVDETATTLVTFRSGGRIMYGIIGVGFNPQDERTRYALEAGLGAHLPLGKNFRINAEAVHLGLTDFKKGEYEKASLRIMPAYRFAKRVEVFGGPALCYTRFTKGKGDGLADHYLWSDETTKRKHGMYIGGLLGVQVHL